MPEDQPKSRIVLVTGGARGIGRAIAVELAQAGWDVALSYRTDSQMAESVVSEIEGFGRRASAIYAELENLESAETLARSTASQFGGLDALVSNAGVMTTAPFVETPLKDLDRQLAINTRGAFAVAQAAAKQMIGQSHGGSIVFITSRAASRPVEGLSAYCMSKAAVKILTEVAALELAPHGIRVNAVAPATIETDLNRSLLADPKRKARALAGIPLGRLGAPEEVGHAVRYLLSDEATFITGTTIAVDGGAAIR